MIHSNSYLLLILNLIAFTASSLKVVIDSKDGKFHVVHNVNGAEQTLFEGGEFCVFVGGQWCHPNASTVNKLEHARSMEKRRDRRDTLGLYTALVQEWTCPTLQDEVRVITTIKNYHSEENVIFEVSWPDGAWGTSTVDYINGSWTGSMAPWPLFDTTTLPSVVSWQGTFFNPVQSVSQGANGGPVVFYNATDASLLTVIVASAWNGNWKAFSSGDGRDWNGNTVVWAPGTSGRIASLPRDYQQSVILHAGSGITNTIHEWGKALQYSRPKRQRKIHDVTLEKIGYQTDNGAYYCFCNEQNCSKTLIDEMSYLKSIGIPMGYLSFQGAGASSGRGAAAPWCVHTWGVDGGLSHRYPVSVKDMQREIGIALQLYAPYFCPGSPYFNGTKWNKVSSNTLFPSCSVYDFEDVSPDQSRPFYDDFFDRGMAAGMLSYESDFMNQNFNCVSEFVRTTTAAPLWQQGMADAANARNLSIQWCMATPSDVLASVDMPSVTNFRVSTDYCYGNSWEIGVSSLLVWALGAAPSKDTLWTSDNNRTAIPGCPWTHDHETRVAELHLVLGLMSTGPVGISDAIGMTNATLLKRAIASDGTLLKPAKAITAVDSSFLDRSLSGLDGYMYGTVGYHGRSWHFVSFKMKQSFTVRIRDFWPPIDASTIGGGKTVLVYRLFHQSCLCQHGSDAVASDCVKLFALDATADSSTRVFVAPSSSFENVTGGTDFSPTIATVWQGCCPKNNWILLGELDKYVPLSPARFTSVVCTSEGVAMELKGSSGEVVVLTALQPVNSMDSRDLEPDMKVIVRKVIIPKSGKAAVSLGARFSHLDSPKN